MWLWGPDSGAPRTKYVHCLAGVFKLNYSTYYKPGDPHIPKLPCPVQFIRYQFDISYLPTHIVLLVKPQPNQQTKQINLKLSMMIIILHF